MEISSVYFKYQLGSKLAVIVDIKSPAFSLVYVNVIDMQCIIIYLAFVFFSNNWPSL